MNRAAFLKRTAAAATLAAVRPTSLLDATPAAPAPPATGDGLAFASGGFLAPLHYPLLPLPYFQADRGGLNYRRPT